MAEKIIQSKKISWHHFPDINEADLVNLEKSFKFHHLDYEDIRSETPISKMDPYKHYVFFVFHVPMIDTKTEQLYGEELYVFLSNEHVVTATDVPIPSLEALFERMEKSQKFRSLVLSKGSAFLLHKILADIFRESLSLVSDLTKEVKRLEQAIENRHDKRLTVDLAHARRNILFLRHIVDPQRTMLTSFLNLRNGYVPDDMRIYFDDVHDILDTIWLATDSLKLLIDGLFDMNEALLSHRTNEIVTLLTFVSAALMVPTLIAGFYGMNVPWLPYASDAQIISMFYLIGILGMAGLVLFIIKRTKS